MKKLNQEITAVFNEIADYLETGQGQSDFKIAVSGLGSEHGEDNVIQAALKAKEAGAKVCYIGSQMIDGLEFYSAQTDQEVAQVLDQLFLEGKIEAAVTMHYPFPIGIATIGKAVSPVSGKEFYLASTTGTMAVDRVEAMVKNAIAGISAAKADGIARPSLGILNLDGARQVELILTKLQSQGYDFDFANSARSDGGAIMRGNDVLLASQDVLVCDSLTGNVLTKMLSSFTSGAKYETVGSGYGPGLGEVSSDIVLIISRASGVPVIYQSILYAASLVQGQIKDKVKAEFAAAKKAGLIELLESRQRPSEAGAELVAPAKEIVAEQIAGIDVLDLEAAVSLLWSKSIYAESGMGCTGPIVMVSTANLEKSCTILKEAGYLLD